LQGGRNPHCAGVKGAKGPLEVHTTKVTPSPQPLSREERGLLVKRAMNRAPTEIQNSAAFGVAPYKDINVPDESGSHMKKDLTVDSKTQ